MSSTSRLIVAMLVVVVLAAAFWVLALSPKRKQASELASTVTSLKSSLAKDRQEVAAGFAARRGFAANYGQLVVLGKAVPAESDTASLLVQLDLISAHSHVSFQELKLENSGTSLAAAPAAAAAAPSTSAAPSKSTASTSSSSSSSSESSSGTSSESSATPTAAAAPTEATASLLPLGATVGSAGFDVMPYTLKFRGEFSDMADFIHGLDVLVKAPNSRVAVNGRLVTIKGFTLEAAKSAKLPRLEATFAVTTYLTSPSEGLTAGATPAAPSPSTATPTSTTTGGAP